MSNKVDLEGVSLWLHDDGILEYDYTTAGMVEIELARRAVEAGASLVSEPTPCLVKVNRVAGVTREAREFFAHSEENRAVSSKVALIVGSMASRILGNFFMGFQRGDLPVRLFTDVDEARRWLAE